MREQTSSPYLDTTSPPTPILPDFSSKSRIFSVDAIGGITSVRNEVRLHSKQNYQDDQEAEAKWQQADGGEGGHGSKDGATSTTPGRSLYSISKIHCRNRNKENFLEAAAKETKATTANTWCRAL